MISKNLDCHIVKIQLDFKNNCCWRLNKKICDINVKYVYFFYHIQVQIIYEDDLAHAHKDNNLSIR